MANLITFETQLGVTFKRIMGVFSAENAVGATALIWTLLSHVAELLAIATLDGRVRLDIVASLLVLETREHIVFQLTLVFFFLHCIEAIIQVSRDRLVFIAGIDVLTEVHIAFNCASWNYQVRVSLRVNGSDVIVATIIVAYVHGARSIAHRHLHLM